MPSNKQLVGKKCVYCNGRPAITWDHVFARSFFPADNKYRANLPKVPSCRECNNKKSDWEGRLTVLFQFSGLSESSKELLESDKVKRMLDGNQKLARELSTGFRRGYVKSSGGIIYRETGFELSHYTSEMISFWNQSIAKAFYYIFIAKNPDMHWESYTINPIDGNMYKYLGGLINNTRQNYNLKRDDCGVSVLLGESDDGTIMTEIIFNSTIQYVVFLKNRYMDISMQLQEISY